MQLFQYIYLEFLGHRVGLVVLVHLEALGHPGAQHFREHLECLVVLAYLLVLLVQLIHLGHLSQAGLDIHFHPQSIKFEQQNQKQNGLGVG